MGRRRLREVEHQQAAQATKPSWVGAGSFVLRAPSQPGGKPGSELGRWPRAAAADLEAALAAARECLQRESSHSGQARRSSLRPDLRRLHATTAPAAAAAFAAALGLDAEEARRHLPESPRSHRRWLETASRVRTAPPGIVLFRSTWGLLHAGFRRRVLEHLEQGSAVVVIDDGRLPMVAAAFAQELEQVGLAPGAFHVLHADDGDLLSVALENGGFDLLHAAGYARTREALLRRLQAQPLPTGTRPAFGEGVLEGGGPELHFEQLVRSEWSVHADDDPVERAEAAAVAAFGRAESLSGQLAGQLGHVHAHPRLLSEFTEALLAALEGDRAFHDPLAPMDADLHEGLRAARQLGLDEGATLIHEGATGSRGGGRNATLSPLVFTNVEPNMRIATLQRPMPLLLLSRGLGHPAAGEPR